MKLESERLYYEYLNDSHFEAYCPQEMDPEVMKYIRKESATKEEARAQFDKYLAYMKENPPYGVFAAFLKETGEQVGLAVLIHLEMDPKKHDRFEVGYRFSKEYWGKGYATELTRAFLKYGFQNLNLPTIWATIKPDNMASHRVLLKAGLTDEGLSPLRGGCRLFKITKDQYENSK